MYAIRSYYEIGSGWGDFTTYIAKTFPDKQIITFEVSPLPYLISKLHFKFSKYKNITLYYGDAFKALDEGKVKADAIFFYLCTALLKSRNNFV